MVPSITLSSAVDMAISRISVSVTPRSSVSPRNQKSTEILVVENDEIQFEQVKQATLAQKVCCCWSACCARKSPIVKDRDAVIDAFQHHLILKYKKTDEPSYGKFIAKISVELAHLGLDPKKRVFQIEEARTIHQKAQELNRRFTDLDNLVKWLRWYKIYQDAPGDEDEKEDVKLQLTSRNRHVRDRKGTIQPFKFSDIYKRILEVPFVEDNEYYTLEKISKVVEKKLREETTDCFDVPSITVVRAIVKELKEKDILIREPPADLIAPDLRRSIEDNDGVDELNAREIEGLLIRKEDYVKAYRNKHRVSLHDSQIINKHYATPFKSDV